MPGWSDIQEVLDDGLSAARRAKAAGRAVVGFMSNNVPAELIHASGAFALQIPTAPLPATPLADQYLERPFDPQARVALEKLLQGELQLLDLLVLPRAVDSFHRLYYVLCELRRSFGAQVPEPFLYDVLQAPSEPCLRYSQASTLAFAQRLAALTGKPLGAAELAASIATYNRLREALERMRERRTRQPSEVSGTRALEVFTAAQRLAPEEFTTALDAWLCTEHEPPATGARTILLGSAQDTPALHRLIAAAGGEVVSDHHWRGELLFGRALPENGDPFDAVTRHCALHSFSPRMRSDPATSASEHAARSGAAAAVFYFHAEDDALCWDEPAQRRALGLPALSLRGQAYDPDPALLLQLRDFFAQL